MAKQTSIHSGISLLFFWFSMRIGWFIKRTFLCVKFLSEKGLSPAIFWKIPRFFGVSPQKSPKRGIPNPEKISTIIGVTYGRGKLYPSPYLRKKVKGISLYVGTVYQHKLLCRLSASQRQVPIRYKHYIICGHIFQWLLSKKQKALKKSYKR